MNWTSIINKLAPTVVSALAGPLAGGAVAALGEIFGLSEPTQDKIKAVLENGQMTGEQISALKMLEMKYQNDEKERGFRYSELVIRDLESARGRDAEFMKAGTRNYRADALAVLAIATILILVWQVWNAAELSEYTKGLITFCLGRFFGYLDNIYSFEFGFTRSDARKTELLARAPAIKG